MKRPRDQPGQLEPAVEKVAREIGAILGAVMPPGYGFALLIFGLGEHPGRMNYVSNAAREDMIVAMKELIANMEGRTHPGSEVAQ